MKQPLKLEPKKPNEDVVSSLKDLLEDAEQGLITEFVLIAKYDGRSLLTATAGNKTNVYEMLGAIEHAKIEYAANNIELSEL